MHKAGIIGLPNVGKSTLFNALINTYQAEVANYPFCTIEPNVGIVNLPDERLESLAKIIKTKNIIPAAFEFIDIAGLVKGASKGEGLGNQFLSYIREVDAIIHVVRCFNDQNIAHVEENIEPIRDIETIKLELMLSDLQQIEKKINTVSTKAKGTDKTSKRQLKLLENIQETLNKGKTIEPTLIEKEDISFYKSLFLLSDKPIIYAANILESDLKNIKENNFVKVVQDYAEKSDSKCVPICAKLESELVSLSKEEKEAFLEKDKEPYTSSGVDVLIKETFNLLGLITFFTTTGEHEVRAWSITRNTKALQAAGIIHSDFERGFIKAEVIKHKDLIKLTSKQKVRDAGLERFEGKDYIVQDGDIIEFKFNL